MKIITSVKFLVSRLWSESEGLRADEGVGVGGKEESQVGIVETQQLRGVTPVLNQIKVNLISFLSIKGTVHLFG